MQWFVNLSLLKKILLICLVMLGSAVCWGAFNTYLAYRVSRDDLNERNRFLVESAYSTAAGLAADVEKGILSKDEAQKIAISSLRNARFDGGVQYFWISTAEGSVVMHPTLPNLEGKDLSAVDMKTADLFKAFGKAATENPDGSVYGYSWSKPGEDKATLYPKLSYVMYFKDWDWVIGTGGYLDELNQNAVRFFMLELGFVALFIFVLVTGTYFAVKVISRPMLHLATNMEILAAGRLEVEVPYANREDEVGKIAKAFGIFKQNAVEKFRLEQRQTELQKQAEIDKKKAMADLAESFEGRTARHIDALAAASEQLKQSALQMRQSSEENVIASRHVAHAITEADQNVQTVASATEELASSSQEIARQISGVAEKSGRSSQEAERTSTEISRLNTLADSIGDVVAAIKGIAEQTNLLALNATIEAARAGDAGKGFAVVADEVKKLAMETASKTTEIDERVVRIQTAIHSTVEAVGRILSDVKDIDHATSTVAGAVEEQNAATSEIGRNVTEASTGTQIVSENIRTVLEQSEETGKNARMVLSAAENLAEVSGTLRNEVEKFLTEIRG